MPDPNPNPPQPLPDPPSGETPERKPAIRTMKSDVQEFFKTTKPSLVQLIGQEARAHSPRVARARGTSTNRWWWVGGVTLLIFFIGGGVAYFFLSSRPEQTPPTKTTPPSPFFATEASRTIGGDLANRPELIRLIRDSARETEREGTIKRLLIKLSGEGRERFADLGDFFTLYHIQPPPSFLDQVEPGPTIFIHYGTSGPRLGLAVRTRDPDRTLRDLLGWETNLLVDLRPLLLDEIPQPVTPTFEDRSYRNIDWRFLKLSSEKDLGIGYSVFPVRNVLVLTTGKAAMESVINRLFEAR